MIYLSCKEAAQYENLTTRALQIKIKNNNIKNVMTKTSAGRKGMSYLIPLESLSQQAQDKYNKVNTVEKKDLLNFTEKQRQEAYQRNEAIEAWQRAKAEKISKENFINQFNESHPSFQITSSQLTRWARKFNVNQDIADLIDTRGGHNKGECSIPDEVKHYFNSFYLREQRLGVAVCYDKVKGIYPDIPEISTFKRYVNSIPKDVITYYRYGKKAFNDQLPYMERDYTSLESNEIWNSDHHQLDIFVRDSQNKARRPWLTTWMDMRSRKIMSYIIRLEDPNSNVVKLSFSKGMRANGKALNVYVDNGKDYKAKENFDKDNPYSLSNILQIGSIFAIPYNAKAKPIESWHRTVKERFSKLQLTYCGGKPEERPESLNKIPIEEYPTLEEITALFDKWLNVGENSYHNKKHRGQGMDNKSPNEVYAENLKAIIKPADELYIFLEGKMYDRIIGKNGISIKDNTYWNDKFVEFKGEKVKVLHSLDNLGTIIVFDKDLKKICTANARLKTMFGNVTDEEYRAAKKIQKVAKKLVKENKPIVDTNIYNIISQNQANKVANKIEKTQDIDVPVINKTSEIASNFISSIKSDDKASTFFNTSKTTFKNESISGKDRLQDSFLDGLYRMKVGG